MNFSFYKNKNINKKIICKVILVIAFFVIQLAIIFYAKSIIKESLKTVGNTEGGSISVLQSQVDQLNSRLQSMEINLNYLRGYIMANANK